MHPHRTLKIWFVLALAVSFQFAAAQFADAQINPVSRVIHVEAHANGVSHIPPDVTAGNQFGVYGNSASSTGAGSATSNLSTSIFATPENFLSVTGTQTAIGAIQTASANGSTTIVFNVPQDITVRETVASSGNGSFTPGFTLASQNHGMVSSFQGNISRDLLLPADQYTLTYTGIAQYVVGSHALSTLNFSVSYSIPEPTSAAAAGVLASIGILRRRRRG